MSAITATSRVTAKCGSTIRSGLCGERLLSNNVSGRCQDRRAGMKGSETTMPRARHNGDRSGSRGSVSVSEAAKAGIS